MKKFLLVCLLGLGMLLPTNNVSANGHFHKRDVKITLQEDACLVASEKTDGPISLLEIRSLPDGKCWAFASCNDYYCSVSTSTLPSGLYVAKAYVGGKVYDKQFKK